MKESFIGFTDKCRNLLDGTVDRGPTIAIIICMLCSVISTLFQILLKFKKNKRLTTRDYINIFINIIILIVNLYILYKLSHLCNSWNAIFIICLLSCFVYAPLKALTN